MKKALLMMTVLFSSSAFSQQCNANPALLKATYTVTNNKNNEPTTQALTLWRKLSNK